MDGMFKCDGMVETFSVRAIEATGGVAVAVLFTVVVVVVKGL